VEAFPRLYVVPRAGPGRLALMAAPRSAPRLAADVGGLAASGVTDVVCLLPDAELAVLGLADEPELLARNGLRLHRLPVPDFGVPDAEAAAALAGALTERLAAGASVVVHCRGGVGRSSMVAALVLVREGLGPDDAWRLLGSARGRRVPETREQRAFVATFAGAPLPPPGPGARLASTAGRALVMLAARTESAVRRGRNRYRP
jgi:protein-tyrosine phosphatase